MEKINKHIEWRNVLKTTGLMLIGSLVTIVMILLFAKYTMNQYIQENRVENFNKKVREIERQLK